MDLPLRKLTEASGLKVTGDHEWPSQVDEDILDFISNIEPSAVFVVEQDDGLVIGPPPRSLNTSKVLVIAKPSGPLPAENWDQYVVSAALPLGGAVIYQNLHCIVSQVILPIFDSQPQSSSTQARHRLVEAERALAQLLRHTQVAFVDLSSGAQATRAQKVLAKISRSGKDGVLEASTGDLNELQSVVNVWKQQVASLASSDRDVQVGSVSDEIGFWVTLEAALQSVQEQLNGPLVSEVWKTLESSKRFHATHNFGGETGLNDACAQVQGYTQILFRDMPIGELLAASTFDQLIDSVEAIFSHINKKLRASGYPTQRSLGLVEAIGRDFSSVLFRITEIELEHILASGSDPIELLEPICELQVSLQDSAEIWDSQVRDFSSLARDLMRRRVERFTVVKIQNSHSSLVSRLVSLATLVRRYADLMPLLENGSIETGGLSDSFHQILSTKSPLQLDENSWHQLEASYAQEAHKADATLAQGLRSKLEAAAHDSDELFDLFSKHQALMNRTEVRFVALNFQDKLLEKLKDSLRGAELRFKKIPSSDCDIVDRLICIKQLHMRAEDVKHKLLIVLGPGWRDHTEGLHIANACDLLKEKLDVAEAFDSWKDKVVEDSALLDTSLNEQPSILRIRDHLGFQVEGRTHIEVHHVRALKALGFRFDPVFNSTLNKVLETELARSRLKDCLACLDSVIGIIKSFPRIKYAQDVSHLSVQVMAFLRLGLTDQHFGSPNMIEYVCGMEQALHILESKASLLASTDAIIGEKLSAIGSIQELKNEVTGLMAPLTSLEYQAAVMSDMSKVIERRICDELENWMPSSTKHVVKIKNHVIQIEPPIMQSLKTWLSDLNSLVIPTKNTEANVLPSFTGALEKIWSAWHFVSQQAEAWTKAQVLWDTNITEVVGNFSGDIWTLSGLLIELRKDRDLKFTADQSVHLDLSQIIVQYESKCDAWQNALIKELALSTSLLARDTIDKSRQARKSLETTSLDLNGMIEGLRAMESARITLQESELHFPALEKAQETLKVVPNEDSKEGFEIKRVLDEVSALKLLIEKREHDLEAVKPRLSQELETRSRLLDTDVQRLKEDWIANKPVQASIDPSEAVAILKRFIKQFEESQKSKILIEEAFSCLKTPSTALKTLEFLQSQTNEWFKEAGSLLKDWKSIKFGWEILNGLADTLWVDLSSAQYVARLEEISSFLEKFVDRTKQLGSFKTLQRTLADCSENSQKVCNLKDSDAIKRRHLVRLIPSNAAIPLENLKLRDIWQKLPEVAVVRKVIEEAEGEYQLFKYLETVSSKWSKLNLEGKNLTIQNLQNVLQLAHDNVAALSAMRSSPYFSAVAAVVQEWEIKVGNAQQVYDKFIDVQRQHLYLQGVFVSKSVISVMTNEFNTFKGISEEYEQVFRLAEGRPALEVAIIPRFYSNLCRIFNQFDSLDKNLSRFIESQRLRFPRLNFIGDQDVLELIGSPIDAWGGKYIPSIFPGISRITHDGVESLHGEKLVFLHPKDWANDTKDNIEMLCRIDEQIKISMRHLTARAIEELRSFWPNVSKFENWLPKFPVQCVLTALREQWSRHIHEIHASNQSPDDLEASYSQHLRWLPTAGDDTILWSRRRELVFAELTHEHLNLSLDSIDLKITYKSADSNRSEEFSLDVCIGSLSWPYGFEYLGVQECIVQTEITDDLFMFAVSAIARWKGCNIVGPAGTGKTESVKALGSLFGRRVIVFNCDDQFDHISVGRVMSGCVATNSWVCFDEFNRLSKGVLSSIAQLISAEIKKAPIFVTMNPEYSGRTTLPPNMRKQFQEFVLEFPQTQTIARILLCAHGRVSPRVADSVVELLRDLSTQTSLQKHYDWGLRALKGILRVCRILQSNMRRACEVAIRPKLTADDKVVFDSLLSNFFPELGINSDKTIPETTVTPLLSEELGKATRLLPYGQIMDVFFGLFPGVMLLGPTGSGKTTLLRALAKANCAEIVVINPSAVSKEMVLGKLDPVIREWTDGILSGILRSVQNDLRGERNKTWYVVFDGEIEPEWAEALNSLLDDTRRLTLASGEILSLPDQVHLIFETSNLNYATPATISRCGIIALPEYQMDEATSFIPEQLFKTARSINHSMKFIDIQAQLICSKLDLGNKWLTTAWALAGDSDEAGRLIISDAIRELSGDMSLPPDGLLTDYYISDLTGKWQSWRQSVGTCREIGLDALSRPEIVIPTAETVSHESLLQAALSSRLPVLLVGPPGSGKTMTLFNALRQISQSVLIPLSFSSTASPLLVIQALEMHCELNKSNDGTLILSPPGSKWGVLFIDEINLPQSQRSEHSDVVPVVQLLRHMIEFGGYYNTKCEFVKIERIQVVGACNPPPLRRPLPNSLLRHFFVLRVDHPRLESLEMIYESFASTFEAQRLVKPMLQVYNQLKSAVPSETWTPRELTRWLRGIYTSWNATPDFQQNSQLLDDLWSYEACRVLTDRLCCASREDVMNILREQAPSGTLNVKSEVWTSLVARRPKFVPTNEFCAFLKARLSVFVEEVSGEADDALVIYEDFAKLVSYMERIFSQPQGHAYLFGPASVGKMTVVKFSSWLVGHELRSLRSHSHYTDADFAQDLRKALLVSVRRPVVLCLGDDLLVLPNFAELMNSLLANGEVPGLFKTLEQKADLNDACVRAGFPGGDFVPWFRSKIVKNLHVVFTVSDGMYASSALLNRCNVIRVESWPISVRQEIAEHWCLETDCGSKIVPVLSSLHISHTSLNMASQGVRFVEACRQFVRAYKSQKFELEDSQRHLISGTDRLKATYLELGQLKQRSADQRTKLAQETQKSSEVLSKMLQEQSEAERKRVAAVEIKIALKAQNQQIAERQRIASENLAATEPLIKQASEGVQNIKKSQLNELKSLMNPPEPVKITLEAVCLLLNLSTDGSWKQVLAAVRGDEFIPRIIRFDSSRLTEEMISRIERDYMSMPSFTYERVDRASKAGGPLLRWVVAQIAYGKAIAAIQPLMAEIESLNEQYKESAAQLNAIEAMLNDLESAIEQSKLQYSKTVSQCEILKSELHHVSLQLDRAESLLQSLSEEKDRWADLLQEYPETMSNLPGKALMEAVLISYSGNLDPQQKIEFAESVRSLATKCGVKMMPELPTVMVRAIDNSSIIQSSWSVTLVVDPGRCWSAQHLRDSNHKVTNFLLDSEILMKEVDAALRFGQTLVIQNSEHFDPLLLPLLTRSYVRKGTRLFVNFGKGDIDVAAGFKLVLHTRDLESTSSRCPFLLSRVNLVDFSVTTNKFEHLVKQSLLDAQLPELANRREELQTLSLETNEHLHLLQQKVLDTLAETSATEKLLDNQVLIGSLKTLKTQAKQLEDTKSSTSSILAALHDASEKFAPQGRAAAEVYNNIRQIHQKHKFYYFSVEWLWEIAQKLAKIDLFIPEFHREVFIRELLMMKSGDWNLISHGAEFVIDWKLKPMNILDAIKECPSTVPIIAGMVTTNAADPGDYIVDNSHVRAFIVAMGSSQAVLKANKLLAQAMDNGNWLIVQNVEVAEESWLRDLIRKLQSGNPASEFRLILTGLQEEIAKMPELISIGRPISIERQPGIKVELFRHIEGAVNTLDSAICWIHACLMEKFPKARFSDDDLAAGRWHARHISNELSLKKVLIKVVWGAKLSDPNSKKLLEEFVEDVFNRKTEFLEIGLAKWATNLPDEISWLPKLLEVE